MKRGAVVVIALTIPILASACAPTVNVIVPPTALPGAVNEAAVSSCKADGAAIQTAMAAFEAQNSLRIVVTQDALIPTYLHNWAMDEPYYAYSIVNGQLKVAVPFSAASVAFTPAACDRA